MWGLGIFVAAAVFLYFGLPMALRLFLNILIPPVNWDVITAKGSDCQLTDHRPVSNHSGLVAVVREANCPGPFAQGTGYYIVFVHPQGQPNTQGNLVFQYTPALRGDGSWELSPLPKVVWASSTSLMVTSLGSIDRFVVQKDSIGPVRVTYRLSP